MRSDEPNVEVKEANRAEHKRMLDTQVLELLLFRVPAEGIESNAFDRFMKRYLLAL